MRLEEDVDAPEHLQRARVPVEDGKDGHLEEGEPLAEEEGPVGDADQPCDIEPQRPHQFAHLAVLALFQGQAQPAIAPALPLRHGLGGRGHVTVFQLQGALAGPAWRGCRGVARLETLVREQAESELAREEWESLGDGEASALTLREPQMAEARAQLASAQASLDEARLNLSRTRISAPFDGRVRAKSADLGQYVGPGTRLGRVFATNRVQVRLPLTNAELAILNLPLAFQSSDANPGRPAHLSASVAGQERHWEGRLVRTDSAINPQTRTMSAIIEVEDPYGAAAEEAGAPLAVGLFVAANIDGRELENAIVLPRSALRGSNEVYVAELDGTLSIRQVNVVDTSAERVVLTAGLEPGDRVVTSPLRGAAEGMLVRAMDANGDPLDPEPEADAANDNDAESEALVQETTTASRAN